MRSTSSARITEIAQEMTEVLVYGTAVIVEPISDVPIPVC